MSSLYNLDIDPVHRYRSSEGGFVAVPGYRDDFAPASELPAKWWPDKAAQFGFVLTIPPATIRPDRYTLSKTGAVLAAERSKGTKDLRQVNDDLGEDIKQIVGLKVYWPFHYT